MKLRRTANAGILLELDGVSILLDGVCREVKPYPATPPEQRQQLLTNWPDVVAFTHAHKDHYDPAYAACYMEQTGRVVLGPASVRGSMMPLTVRGVRITPVQSRHIGAAGKDTPHASFVIQGSKTVWFMGDSAPSQWRGKQMPGEPDVLIVPYAYTNTPSSWAFTQSLRAHTVLVHMPTRRDDTIGLWETVDAVTREAHQLDIPEMGEMLSI